MDRLGESHNGCYCRTRDGAAEPLNGTEAVAEKKELADADADNSGDQLTAEEVARLREGRLDSVKLKDSARTLRMLALMTPAWW